MRGLALVCAVVGGCGGSGSPAITPRVPAPVALKDVPAATTPVAVTPVARQVSEDTVLRTASGSPVSVPPGWWVTEGTSVLRVEDPDRQVSVWFVESSEPDAAKAIADAWKLVTPTFALVGTADVPPPHGGWAAITDVSYDAAPGRTVEASARRSGRATFVTLVDGDQGVIVRRGAQIAQAIESWMPPGMHDESLVGQVPRALDAAVSSELDAFLDDARTKLGVPGVAVGLVVDGKVVYEHASGVRALGKADPVTRKTLFMIGSVTKPMTTLMEAALVDAKLFTWETPVTTVLPSFALGDPELTKKVLMWHMSCACTGMPRNDLEHIFEYRSITPEERVASMASMKPTTALGETYQYSNLMVAAGGYAAAHAFAPKKPLGEAYDAAMRAKIFGPIGMSSTTFDFKAALRAEHAMPHAPALDGTVQPVLIGMEQNVVNIRPAGGAWTNLADFERYAMTELADGVAPSGARVASPDANAARRTLRVHDGSEKGGYGIGLGIDELAGLRVLGHDGGAFGFGSTLYLMPDQRVGIVILTNVRNGAPTEYLPFNTVVKRRLVEALFPAAQPIAATQLTYFAQGIERMKARASIDVDRSVDIALTSRLVGTFRNDRLGTVRVRRGPGESLTFDAGEWRQAMGQRTTNGVTALIALDPPFAGTEIMIGGDEAHPTLTVGQGDMSFILHRIHP